MLSRRILTRLLGRINTQQTSVRHHNFDGETYSKTNLSLMTKEDDSHTYIEAFSPLGFRLTSGFRILGPCVIFPKSVLHWNVASSEKIEPASLSLFCMLEPKLDLLVLGIGDRGAYFDKDIIRYLRSKKINVEILPTEQACSTFNFLNSERRVVAAALIPPRNMDVSEDRILLSEIDDMMSFEEEERALPDSPIVSKTMKSFHEKGMLETFREGEESRKRSSPGFRHEDENSDVPPREKPR